MAAAGEWGKVIKMEDESRQWGGAVWIRSLSLLPSGFSLPCVLPHTLVNTAIDEILGGIWLCIADCIVYPGVGKKKDELPGKTERN